MARVRFGVTNGILDEKNFDRLKGHLQGQGHEVVSAHVSYAGKFDYDVLIVGQDWHHSTRPIVNKANSLGRKTILVQSEGLFVERAKWYHSAAPVCKAACVWGKIHEDTFRERGYKGNIYVCGPPRYDRYYGFTPQIDKNLCYQKLGIPAHKSLVTFATQYFDGTQGPTKYLNEGQRGMTIAMSRLAGSDDLAPIIKMHPQEVLGATGFDRVQVAKQTHPAAKVIDVEPHSELIEIGTLIYHSSVWVAYTSSTIFEAALLGTPAISVNFVRDSTGNLWPLPIDYPSWGLATYASTSAELIAAIGKLKGTRNTVGVDNEFIRQFLTHGVDGQNTGRVAAALRQEIPA